MYADREDGGTTEDAIDYFESSLEFLFGHHQSASGVPGRLYTLQLAAAAAAANSDDALTLKYRIPASKTTKLFAHYQWDSGLYLSELIHRHTGPAFDSSHAHEADVRGKSVVELGAGTGLPGLVSARRGASSVLITDYPDEGILLALQENVTLANVQHIASVRGLDWADEKTLQQTARAFPHRFDRVLCADVLWLSSSHAPLLNTIHTLLTTSSTARCILVSGFHTGRRALSHFFHMALTTSYIIEGRERKLAVSGDRQGLPCVVEFNVIEKTFRSWTGLAPFPGGGGREEEDSISGATSAESMVDNMDDYDERTKWLLYVVLQWSS